MDFKTFWKTTFVAYVIKNILVAIGIIVVLSFIVILCLGFYTHHGEAEIVPNLQGMYVDEAQQILSKKGLSAQVVDSVYVRDKKLGTIISQTPISLSKVKSNRSIYVVINSRHVKNVSFPDLNDVSERQAILQLKSIGLQVLTTEYIPSEYEGLVIDAKYHGRSLNAGASIPEGSSVILVVGEGSDDNTAESEIPDLTSKSLSEATQILQSALFVVGAIVYDIEPSGNADRYFIYRQQPAAGKAKIGSHVNLYLTTDKRKLSDTRDNDQKPEDEKFF